MNVMLLGALNDIHQQWTIPLVTGPGPRMMMHFPMLRYEATVHMLQRQHLCEAHTDHKSSYDASRCMPRTTRLDVHMRH